MTRRFAKGLIVLSLFLLPALSWSQEDLVQRRNSFAIYPAIAYTPESSLIFGPVAVFTLKGTDESQQEFLRQSTFTPLALYTLKNQFLAELNLVYYFKNGQNLNIVPRFLNFPDFYFGIGNDNDPNKSESYTNRFFQTEGQYYVPISKTVFIGSAFDLHITDLRGIKSEGLLQTDNPQGINGGNLFGIGPAIRQDSRDNTIYPTTGSLLTASALFNEIGDFSYSSYLFDLRKYISIRNDKNVIALQWVTRMTEGSNIPFYKLPQLGGSGSLRGISNASLYRDNQMVFSQVEYRRHIWERIGVVVFAGLGEVTDEWSNLDLSNLKYVGGIGYRFQVLPDERLNLRLDFGVSQDGQTGFYIGMQEAF